jgi:hypothetical protein
MYVQLTGTYGFTVYRLQLRCTPYTLTRERVHYPIQRTRIITNVSSR